MKTYVVLLLVTLPFEGNGIENHFAPDELTYGYELPKPEPVLPQWLKDRIRILPSM